MAKAQVLRIVGFDSPAEDWNAAINCFFNFCRAKNLSPRTIAFYGFRLAALQRYLDANAPGTKPKDVTSSLVRAFVTAESEATSSLTANHDVTTLKTLFNYLCREGFVTANPMDGVDKLKVKRRVLPTFTMDQLEAVLATCGKDFVGVRDKALILTLLDCGLRVSELCGLSVDDVNWTEGTLLVLGKGNRERVVPFGQALKQSLAQYVARRGDLPTKALFVTNLGTPLDRYRVREIVKERCRAAGITGVRCSPHTMRHTAAIAFLRNGGDVFSLQKLLGHSSLEMSRRYAELADSDLVAAHRRASPADRLSLKSAGGRKRLK